MLIKNKQILKDILLYPIKRKIKRIILHYSWSLDTKLLDWEAIRNYHIFNNGWNDIGYHFGIERVNNNIIIQLGQPLNKIAYHAKGYNYNSIGICIVGNYDTFIASYDKYDLLANLCKVLLYKTKLNITDIRPHWIYNEYKTCPGRKFDFSQLRKQIKTKKSLIIDLKNEINKDINNGKKAVC